MRCLSPTVFAAAEYEDWFQEWKEEAPALNALIDYVENVYKSMAFMLVADDDQRDYGDPVKGEELKEKWESSGYQVISMANDWNTIYGEDVVKTGEFHWLEELAEERIPAGAEERTPAEQSAVVETVESDTSAAKELKTVLQKKL